LTTIRLTFGTHPEHRYAKYANGVLELSIVLHLYEAGTFYEYEIASVLDGEIVGDIPTSTRAYDEVDDDESDADDSDAESDEDETDDDEDNDDDADSNESDNDDSVDDIDKRVQRRAPPKTEAQRKRDQQLNDDNFRTAEKGLKENESIWAMQL